MEPYSPQVLAHYTEPRNPGALPGATGRGRSGDGAGGDLMIEIAIRASGDVVEEARFRAFGCSATIAAASATTVLLRGRDLPGARTLSAEAIEAALGGLPEGKRHCAEHAALAARAAVEDHERGMRDER